MQPRTWLVAALLVAWAGVAQPIIIVDPFLGGAVLAAGGAAALLGAATIGAGAVGAGVLGAGAIGAAKVGAAAAVGKGVVGAAALGAGKVGLAKVGLAKVGLGTILSSSSTTSYGSNEHSSSYGRSYGGSASVSINKRFRREVPGYTAAQELLLRNAFELDQEKPCGLRLVCELATRGSEELAEDERLILRLLQTPHSLNSMAVPYEEAALLGTTSPSGPDACARVYQGCDLNAFQVMELLRTNA